MKSSVQRRFDLILAFMFACVLAGCQTTTPPPNVNTGSRIAPVGPAPLDFLDPCGDRIEDLSGAWSSYYKVYQHGPAQIEELAPFAPSDAALNFTCPVSGKKYLCSPDGLKAPGEKIRIFIYDAEPVHGGQRWYVRAEPGPPSQPMIPFTEHMPEARFKRFLESAAPKPNATP